jgi:probable phosphoglycerate mutase
MEQAKATARALHIQEIRPAAVYAGTLSRLTGYAAILCDHLDLAKGPIRTCLLDEVNYGVWGGLTSEQIQDLGLAADLKGWENEGIWPQKSGWEESEVEALIRVKTFLRRIQEQHPQEATLLAITSNGLIRLFLRFCGDEYQTALKAGKLKVKTGNYCVLEQADGKWRSAAWNQDPRA